MSILLLGILAWKLLDIGVSILSPHFIPYLGFFSYGADMFQYHTPDFIRALTNFDGIFYIRIALQGYSYTEQAYFPLYPLVIRSINGFFHNPILSGVFASQLCGAAAIVIFYNYLKLVAKPKKIMWILLFFLAYPTSYYFNVMYTESLFFLLFISTLYCFKKENYVIAFVLAYLTALTRVVGIFLFFPLALFVLKNFIEDKHRQQFITKNWKQIFVSIAPVLGLATYCFYLWKTTGDPLFFFHVQKKFGAHRSSNLIFPPQVLYRYLKIYLTARVNFQYFISVIELIFYGFGLSLLVYDLKKILQNKLLNYDRLGLNIFSLTNILLSSLTGTLTATPRYSLLSISMFFVLGEIKNRYTRYAILTVFIALHICLFAFFIQGYYVT